jgi:cytochrome c oxidase cbb3-type subunit 3
MSEFTSVFWDIYIAVITLVSIIACGVFLKMQSVRKVSGTTTETTGHTWDEDLGEYNNPLPRWWMWLFYITIFFSLAYLVLYPGLGSYAGYLGWSSHGQYEAEQRRAAALYDPVFERYLRQDVEQVAADPEALRMAQRLFLNHCAQCHASDGGGSRGFPNLTDRDWLWGGDPAAIRTSIAEGRAGVMPPLGAAVGGDEGARNVAQYVRSLSGLAYDSLRAVKGRKVYAQVCAACHGADGKGNQQLGAPNLTDEVWLYGSSEAMIVEAIMKGRNNRMPPHKDMLSEAKIHLLTAYVYAISGQVRAAGGAAK